MAEQMRVLGIDPGSRITGYGIVDLHGNKIRYVASGTVTSSSSAPMADRLQVIHAGLVEVIQRYQPTVAAIETIFAAKNVQSSLKLGQARGVLLLAVAQSGLSATEFAPTRVKKAVVGVGRADKGQVQQMVKILLGLPKVASQDASDALAVAICRCQHRDLPAAWPPAAAKAGISGRAR